jgi:hypothetical protein
VALLKAYEILFILLGSEGLQCECEIHGVSVLFFIFYKIHNWITESRWLGFRWSGDEDWSGGMEVRSDGGGGSSTGTSTRFDKLQSPVIARTRLQVWFIRVCSSIVLWTCLVQLVAVGELWHPHLLAGITNRISRIAQLRAEEPPLQSSSPPPLLPASEFCS